MIFQGIWTSALMGDGEGGSVSVFLRKPIATCDFPGDLDLRLEGGGVRISISKETYSLL